MWLTPISRGRVSHSDSGLNTVGGVLACPWFVNDWHSLRIMPLSDVEKNKEHEKNKLLQIKRRFSRIDLFFEEGVCRWHMTDEKRDLDRKDSLR